MRNVCIFAASSPLLEKRYIDAAYELGRCLASRGIGLVFGGGRTGLMGACARGVHSMGGRLTGVIPEKLNQPGIAFEHCTELIVTSTMHERKAEMERLSDGYIALPGGFGTLEELMEVLTLNQLGYLSSPVVIMNCFGFYDDLISLFSTFVAHGFTDERCLSLFSPAENPEEAVNALLSFKPPKLPDKIKEAISHGKG